MISLLHHLPSQSARWTSRFFPIWRRLSLYITRGTSQMIFLRMPTRGTLVTFFYYKGCLKSIRACPKGPEGLSRQTLSSVPISHSCHWPLYIMWLSAWLLSWPFLSSAKLRCLFVERPLKMAPLAIVGVHTRAGDSLHASGKGSKSQSRHWGFGELLCLPGYTCHHGTATYHVVLIFLDPSHGT